mmetsp:Transcript_4414/g.10601  ORF Transcript_4414/g.10601 Transcript_4414/m.10601 type:complete len:545 (+) Transcript_4414:153-1787(+)
MKILSAAMSFISLPSPKGDAFREGPKKEKRKSRSLRKALSPIRRMSKQLSKLSNRNSPKKDKKERESKTLQARDEEQGWIAPAATFETEDTLSPRSFDSLTTSDSTPLLVQSEEKDEEISFFSVTDTPNQMDDDEFLDLEAGFNESANTTTLFRRDIDVQNYTNEVEYFDDIMENCEAQNAAPHVDTEIQEELKSEDEKKLGEEYAVFQELEDEYEAFQELNVMEQTSISSQQEETRDSMVSLLYRLDTTEVIDEGDEIDSLAPAADISFFLNEEDGDDFHCVGRLQTPQKEMPPVEIDVDSIDDLSNSSAPEGKSQELYLEDDDEISVASYSSYLHAIESITASANSKVEGAIATAWDELDIETPPHALLKIEDTVDLVHGSDFQFDDEEDNYRISFNPSRELLLQAMEGASAKAKADIEQATALALSKMNSAKAVSSKRNSLNAPNRVLGFLFFLLLLFQFNRNSFQFLSGIKSISQSVGIDQFQIQAHNDVLMEPQLDLGMWRETQMRARDNETNVAVTEELYFYNVGCINKIGCLALGNL